MIAQILMWLLIIVGGKFVSQLICMFVIGLGHIRTIKGQAAFVVYLATVVIMAFPVALINYARI